MIAPRPTRADWAAVDRSIFRETGLTPTAIDRLTLSELAVLLEEDAKPGENVLSEEEVLALWQRSAGMTAEERLWAAEVG